MSRHSLEREETIGRPVVTSALEDGGMSQGISDMISTAGGVDSGTVDAGLETLREQLELSLIHI